MTAPERPALEGCEPKSTARHAALAGVRALPRRPSRPSRRSTRPQGGRMGDGIVDEMPAALRFRRD